jgi:two-component sensor histidine kinase
MLPPRPDRSIERLLRQQAALAAFGSYAFREPVLLNVLNDAARVCADGLGVKFCKICRYRPEENDLQVEAGFGWDSEVIGTVVSSADETSPQGRAYVTGRPVIMLDIRVVADLALPAFYGAHHVVSTVDVIIKGTEGDAYGVLEIGSDVEQTYDQHDIDFLTGFANVLAEAVATVSRAETLRQTIVRMEALVIEKDRLLTERNVMAEELKHRVRNNLQLVAGMLTSHLHRHASTSGETPSISAIVHRVMTLAEVYEQLLGTGFSRAVDFGQYLRSLCDSLPGLQKNQRADVVLTCEACVLLVDLDTATALGMAVAELVSNGYEHGLGAASGSIQVSLEKPLDEPHGILVVRDSGAGFVEKPGSKRHGVGLVRRLVEQVHGMATMAIEHGTVWTIAFPVDPLLGQRYETAFSAS